MYDGSINISTKVDASGVNKGTKSITSSLGGVLRSVMAVAKTMAAVFAGGAIISGIRSLIGQFDIMGSSIGASVKQLSTAFDALKGAFVNLILAALAPLIPYVITFVQWLTQLFNIVTQIIGALFGVKAGFGGVASAAGGAGKATQKAAKEAAGALAAFDQINVLQTKKDEPNTGGGGGGISTPVVDPISPELLAKLEKFKADAIEFFRPLTEGLRELREALEPLGQTLWAGLQWAWDNILVPIGTWTMNELVPEFLELLAEASTTLNEALIALQPLWQDFYDNFLKPLGEWTGDKIIEILDGLTEKLKDLGEWIKENPEKFREFVEILGTLAGIVLLLAGSYQIALGLSALFSLATIALSGAFWSAAAAALAVTWPIIALTLLIAGIIAVVYLLITRWEELSTTVKQIGFIIGFYVSQMADKIKTGFFSALDAIKTKFETIFTGIQNFVKGAINNIIGFINNMIANVVNGINGLIGNFNVVGNLVPGFSPVMMVSAPQIPHLATGAVIPPNSEFLAMLGDQKSGVNIEAPADLIRQIVREETGRGGGGEMTVHMPVYLDGQKIYESVKKIDRRIGPSLIVGG